MDSMLYHPVFRNVPEEIVHEILSHHLSVPDDLFCNTSWKSPFAKCSFDDVSSSAVLEVCKQWLRVGTPLLYHTVVLRSRGQVQRLWSALLHNPLLRRHVRKVRIEGGYGSAVGDVLKCMTAMTDVWINLRLYATETGRGFVRGLPFIDPVRVILRDVKINSRAARPRKETFEAIIQNLPRWKNLRSFHYLCDTVATDLHVSKLMETLPTCTSLQHVHFSKIPTFGFLKELHGHRSLVEIRVLDEFQKLSIENALVEPIYKALLKKVVFAQPKYAALENAKPIENAAPAEPPPPPPPPALNVEPLLRADRTTRAFILTKIIRYATHLPQFSADRWWLSVYSDHPYSLNFQTTRWFTQLLLVCREFRAVALPMLYETISLLSVTECVSLANVLQYSDYGRHIRVIVTTHESFSHPSFQHILRRSTNLTAIAPSPATTCDSNGNKNTFIVSQICHGLPCSQFTELSALVGKSLQCLASPVQGAPNAPRIDGGTFMASLWMFRALRSLVWSCSTPFNPNIRKVYVLSDALPCLEHLVYSSSNVTFLELLACMELPALHAFRLSSYITRLRMQLVSHVPGLFTELCPNVEVFCMQATSYPCDALTFREVIFNNSLKEIAVLAKDNDYTAASLTKKMITFLPHLELSGFEALEKLKLDEVEWPTEQHEIDKNPLVRLAEKCWGQWRVKIVGKRDIAWRPRVKAR